MKNKILTGTFLIGAILSLSVTSFGRTRDMDEPPSTTTIERAADSLQRRASFFGIDTDGLTNDAIQSRIDEARLLVRAADLGIDTEGLTAEGILDKINEAARSSIGDPLLQRAAALGIDIEGLTDEELLAEIKNTVTVSINNRAVKFDQRPIIENGRTLVPMRAIFEALGLSVYWDAEKQEVTAYSEDVVIKMTIGSKIMTVGDTEIELDAAPRIVNGRTLVPVRAISDAIGSEISWDNDTRSVAIEISPEMIQRRAAALGIDTYGLDTDEIFEKINEIRQSRDS